jgi:F-type H+-transporting ATPase subunit epsilon
MSEHLLEIDIVTPQRIIYSGKAESVSVPGTQGPFQVLFNHAPIVSSLDIGAIKILNEDHSETIYATDGGFVEVLKNRVSVVVETADEASSIDTSNASAKIEELKITLDATQNYTQRDELKRDIAKLENRVRIAAR